MIYVNGVRFLSDSSSAEGHDMVIALLEHPHLVSASHTFCAISERKFAVSEDSESVQAKCVYVFQREYATADPALVEIVGTDEATTCVGIVVRNCRTGMTSIGHMDTPDIVDIGLSQMLSLITDTDDVILDVHLVGAFDDSAPQVRFNSLCFAFEFNYVLFGLTHCFLGTCWAIFYMSYFSKFKICPTLEVAVSTFNSFI